MNFFDYLNSINSGSTDIMTDDDAEKAYNIYMVNKGLMYFQDTIMFANLMNENSNIPARQHYDFLRRSVRKRKRFSKWHKASKDEDIQFLADYLNCSRQKAKEYITVVNPQVINNIKEKMKTGGIGK